MGLVGPGHRPAVDQVDAIWHKANQATINASTAGLEWLQLDLENVHLVGYNPDASGVGTPAFIDLEIGCRAATWRNVWGDSIRNIVGGFDTSAQPTRLVRTRYQYTGGADPVTAGDTIGLGIMEVVNCHPMIIKGGWATFIEGRAYRSNFHDCFSKARKRYEARKRYDVPFSRPDVPFPRPYHSRGSRTPARRWR